MHRIHSIIANDKKTKTKKKERKATKNEKQKAKESETDGVKHKLYIINNYIYIHITKKGREKNNKTAYINKMRDSNKMTRQEHTPHTHTHTYMDA